MLSRLFFYKPHLRTVLLGGNGAASIHNDFKLPKTVSFRQIHTSTQVSTVHVFNYSKRTMSSQIGNGSGGKGPGDDDDESNDKTDAEKTIEKIKSMSLDDFKSVEELTAGSRAEFVDNMKAASTKYEIDHEEKYKNDPRYIPTPKCPSCGGPGERFNPNVNSRFHNCPSCKLVYMTQTMEEQKRKESVKQKQTQAARQEKDANEFIKKHKDDLPPSPRLINEYLTEYVIGQENARKVLAVATYNHYKRVKRNFLLELEKERSTQAVQNPQIQEGISGQKTNPMSTGTVHTNLTGHILRPRGDGPPTPPSTTDLQTMAIKNKLRSSGRGFPSAVPTEPEEPNEFAHIEALSGKMLKQRLEDDIQEAKNRKLSPTGDVELDKSNVLMVGPTGTGKTHIAKSLAKALGVPFVVADATTLTAAGYVGEDADTILSKLVRAADGDVKRAETGIVFIDEIDKIATKGSGEGSGSKDVGGESVQQALLKILEGTKVELKKKGPPSANPAENQTQVVDTTNILFIGSGAFVGLDRIIERRTSKKVIGFGKKAETDDEKESSGDDDLGKIGFGGKKEEDPIVKLVKMSQKKDKLLNKMSAQDLQAFGLIPEFIGRMPVRVSLNSLTEDDLMQILTKPKNAIIPQFQALFRMDGAELDFDDDALKAIARQALKQGTGARGLRSIIEQLLLDPMFEVPDSDIIKVAVNEACITDQAPVNYTRMAEDLSETEPQTVDFGKLTVDSQTADIEV
jgi:ATP-dependent Clp protease ATP-binding subunit ClpX